MTVLAILVLVAIPLVVVTILGASDEGRRWWEPAVEALQVMATFAVGAAFAGALAWAGGWALGVLFGGGQ